MRTKGLVSAFLAFLLIATVTVGCSSSTAPGSSNQASTASSASAGSQSTAEPTAKEFSGKLVMWDTASNEKLTPDLIADFKTRYPGVDVQVDFNPDGGMTDKYLLALTSGTGPDIVNINNDWITTFAKPGGLLALDDFIAADNYDMSDFYEGALYCINVDNKVYGLPYRAETHGLFFNTDLITEAPKNWNEALDMAKKATGGDVFGIAVPGANWGNLSTQLFNMIRCNGGKILNDDNTKCLLSEPEALEMANFYVDLYKNGISPKSTPENDNLANRNLFASGKVGMYMSGAYDIAPIKEANPNLKFATSVMPTNKERVSIFAGWSIAIAKSSKNAEAAWELCKFLAEPENSMKYTITFPARKSLINDARYSDSLIHPMVEAIADARPLPMIPEIVQIKQIVFEKIQLAIAGSMTTDEAMAEATKAIDELLAK